MEVEREPRTNPAELHGGPEHLHPPFFMIDTSTSLLVDDGLFKAKSRKPVRFHGFICWIFAVSSWRWWHVYVWNHRLVFPTVVPHKTKLIFHPKLISKTLQFLIYLKNTSIFRLHQGARCQDTTVANWWGTVQSRLSSFNRLDYRSTWNDHRSNNCFKEDESDPQNSFCFFSRRLEAGTVSSYISTPNNHSFIEYVTFPGFFFSILQCGVQCPHVKSSFRQTLTQSVVRFCTVQVCFPGLYPVKRITWVHHDSQSYMNTDAVNASRLKIKLSHSRTCTYKHVS